MTTFIWCCYKTQFLKQSLVLLLNSVLGCCLWIGGKHVLSIHNYFWTVTVIGHREQRKHRILRFYFDKYKFKLSLKMPLLPYVENYRSSTFFCAPQLITGAVLVGSWWPGGLGSYRLPRRRYDPTKHTLPNYRPWVMSPMYGLVRFYRRAICNTSPPVKKCPNLKYVGVWSIRGYTSIN